MKASETKVEKFLSFNKTQFIIPLYQRNYSWHTAHCKQLLTDILEVAHHTEENAAYFIGSIVYVQDNYTTTSSTSEFVIVDGQQRLTTLTLIYIVLYRRAKESNNENLADEIYETYLTNKFSKDTERIKLKPIEGDDTALEHLLNGKDSKEYRDFSRIIDAFDYFDDHITDKNFDNVQNGLRKLMFVEIALDRNHDDPQKIFESLNSTGLNLSQADLIRNYILMGRNLNEQKELYKNYWEVIETHAKDEEGNDNKIDASAFTRDYITLKYKQIPNKGKVYLEFKKKYPQKEFERLKEDLAEMVRLVKLYHKLINPKREENKNIQTELTYVRRLDVSVAHPFLMKVYDDYENQQHIDAETFIAVLKFIQSFVFRRLIVAVPTNALNKIFMSLYEKIDTADYLYSIQKTLAQKVGVFRFPRNIEVENALKEKDIYSMNQKNKNYLFEKLENHENKERVVMDESITIEHIFPQKPDHIWRDELGKDACKVIQEQYLHTIGNLTLSGNNVTLSNKSFREKRDLKENGYKDSRLWLNKSLSSLDQWNEEAIKTRCTELTKRFLNVWAYPDITLNETEYEDEVNIFEVDDPTHKKPEYIVFMDEKTEHKTMKSVYLKILEQLFDIEPELFFGERMKEKIILEKDKKNLSMPSLINNAYYVETNLSNKVIFDKIKHALRVCNLEDELTIKFYS